MDENKNSNEAGMPQDNGKPYPGKGDTVNVSANTPVPENTASASEPSTTGGNVTDDISQRLSKDGKKDIGEGVVDPIDTTPFDISKLTEPQLQELKMKLAVTPDTPAKKQENPRIRLRKIDGKIMIDFKNAYLGIVKDHEQNRDVERHLIPIKLMGEKEYKTILYSNFINSEQVECEVLSQRQEKVEIVEGTTVSRQTGAIVEMIRKEVKHFFSVKLPDGSTLDIEGRMANA